MLGDERPAPETSASVRLSQREHDILELLAENRSDREIAVHLTLAYSTVKWYNRQIFNKLGVDNRQQAVERAFDLGWLEPPQSAHDPDHNLPKPLTLFVGRLKELEDLTRLLIDPHTRLVTILAPGGMGKTRLALATAQSVLGQFANGIHFVPFAALTSPEHLVPTIASAIGFQFSPDRRMPKQQLIDYLRTKQILLVLDNFEHLTEGAALVAELLSAAPELKVLVTSRERLKLEWETVYPLGGLPYPEQDGKTDVLAYDAVQLFMERAQRANSRFTTRDAADIVRICQLVQGMLLAIELAGAWCAMLSPAEIVAEITRSADFLRTTSRNVPERLQSVRTMFEATWRRLSDDERQVFRRLSVFRGGFTRESAQVVVGADLRTLAGLVDKALLWYQPESGRYSIHELLRQYAAEQLAAAGEA